MAEWVKEWPPKAWESFKEWAGNLKAPEWLLQPINYIGAAILKGTDCDMYRLEDDSHLKHFFRFSFGPLEIESFNSDIEILIKALENQ